MGLDNGLLVKSDKRVLTRDMLPAGIIYPFENDYNNDIEIAYWRKCWNIRFDVMNHFNWRFESDTQWQFPIDKPEQILELIEILASWLDEERWEEDGNSIWTYKEVRQSIINAIVNCAIIYTFMLNNPDVYLVFYDSY